MKDMQYFYVCIEFVNFPTSVERFELHKLIEILWWCNKILDLLWHNFFVRNTGEQPETD